MFIKLTLAPWRKMLGIDNFWNLILTLALIFLFWN